MPLEFLLYAMGAAVLFGVSPIFSKRGLSNYGTYLEASLVSVTVSLILFVVLSLLLVDQPFAIVGHPAAVGVFLGGGVVGSALGRLTMFEGEHRVGASIARAILSTAPVVSALLGFVVLDEGLSLRIIVGIGILVGGMVILSLSRGGNLGGWSTRDLVFPVATAFFVASGNVIRRFGLVEHPVDLLPALVVNEVGGLGFILLFVYWKRESVPLNLSVKNLVMFVFAGLSISGAMVCLFNALRQGPVAIVESLAATAPLFTLVLAYVFLGDLERITRGVVIGAGLVSLGAILVSFG